MPVDLDPTTDFIAGTILEYFRHCRPSHCSSRLTQSKSAYKIPIYPRDTYSVSHAFATIIREERFSGLYKGIASPLATCAFMNGLIFASYKFFLKAQMVDDSIPSLTQVAIAGSCCGIAMSIFSAPVELIKIRQQNMNTVSRGYFVVSAATALRDFGYGAYFLGYEAASRYLTTPSPGLNGSTSLSDSSQGSIPLWVLFVSGGVAGVLGWLPTFPMDVVKTRMQSTETAEARSIMRSGVTTCDNPYRTTISTIRHSYRTGGVGVFFHGLSPTMLRAIPVNMATFAVYETVAGMLSP
ncbi:carnitine/acyl carnitine carrier [Suillus lakei]|nr:carnitine/acyl carnitine carrier [Suillus lakei]